MSYTIRRATRDDVTALVQHTLDMAIETENRSLCGDELARGMRVTFERPNLADYYVVDYDRSTCAGESDSEEVGEPLDSTTASSVGASESERGVASPTCLSLPTPAATPTAITARAERLAKPPVVVAFMMTTRDYRMRTATSVQLIQTVYVAPAHRRHGLFRRLYNHVRAEVEQDPTCEGVWLYVEETNVSAIRAYERMGMRREDKHMMRWSKCGF